MRSPSPTLWIVATPLGNPGDITARAREVLASSGLILAEDTRRAARLLREQEIEPAQLLSFFEHNEQERLPQVLQRLKNGEDVALISDAGTPLIADPGYRLVRACREAGMPVRPVPGPSAPIAALSASGLPPIPFTFLGFLPRESGARKKLFSRFRNVPGSLVFFERKDRVHESLDLAEKELGDRDAAVCRELTKPHEEFISGRLRDLAGAELSLLGEVTVIIGPPEELSRTEPEKVLSILRQFIDAGLKPRKAARMAQSLCEGWDSRELYSLVSCMREDSEDNAQES